MNEIVSYINENTWFKINRVENNCIQCSTEKHGGLHYDSPGAEDLLHAENVKKLLLKTFENLKVSIGTLDSSVILTIETI